MDKLDRLAKTAQTIVNDFTPKTYIYFDLDRLTVDELRALIYEELTEKQRLKILMPVRIERELTKLEFEALSAKEQYCISNCTEDAILGRGEKDD